MSSTLRTSSMNKTELIKKNFNCYQHYQIQQMGKHMKWIHSLTTSTPDPKDSMMPATSSTTSCSTLPRENQIYSSEDSSGLHQD
eukprot:3605487-Amphidinium_carterae.1